MNIARSRIVVITVLLAIVSLLAALWMGKATVPTDDVCPEQFADGRPPALDASHGRAGRTLCFSQFAVRYSDLTKTPLWSAEHLTGERLRASSGLPRAGDFHEELRLPAARRSELKDYRRTGYDRGHMAPSGDMSTLAAQRESFSLINIVPQHPCSNQGLWSGIESAVRRMAMSQDELFVVTGPVYSKSGTGHMIGRGVSIPDEVYKAVYDPVTDQAGAYLAENADGMTWQAVSLVRLKELTGIDAFPSLDDDVKAAGMKLPEPEKSRYKCRLHSSGEVPQ